MSVNAAAASTALIWILRAWRRTCTSSVGSSMSSTFAVRWREPRAANPSQVWSRHCKKPTPAPQNNTNSGSRHQRLAPRATRAPRPTTLLPI